MKSASENLLSENHTHCKCWWRLSLRQQVGLGTIVLALLASLMLVLADSAFERMRSAQKRNQIMHAITLDGQHLLRFSSELLLSQGSKPSREDLQSAVLNLSADLNKLPAQDAVRIQANRYWPTLKTRVDELLALRIIDASDETTLIAYGRLVNRMSDLKPTIKQGQLQSEEMVDQELQTGEFWLVGGLFGLTALVALAGLILIRLLNHQLGGDPSLALSIASTIADDMLDLPVPVAAKYPKSVLAALEHVRIRLLERRTIEQHVHYLARYDSLSDALNRVSFNELLNIAFAQAKRGNQGLAVMYIDLDHFKSVNDSFGHAHGDEVIRRSAQRLRALLRTGDHLARLGGDEFAIIVQHTINPQDYQVLAQRIIDSLTQPIPFGNNSAVVGASIGIALYAEDVCNAEELMHKADLAMYRAKTNGRGGWSLYDEQYDDKLREQREIIQELSEAIGSDQFSLDFQPIFSNTQQLTGYEALLRWDHPQRGNLAPLLFIGSADAAGLMQTLGLWVLQTACQQASQWNDTLCVSVNLSASQLLQGNLVSEVRSALTRSGLPARRLKLEINESLLLQKNHSVAATLEKLAHLGVAIVMDDFGSGPASLSYLWKHHFSQLKLDRSLLAEIETDPHARMVVGSVISMAHALNISVCASGIHQKGQFDLLQALGCDQMQGFLLGKPAPIPAVRILTNRIH